MSNEKCDSTKEEAAIALAMKAYPGTTRALWDYMEPWVKDGYRRAVRETEKDRKTA